MTQYYTQREVLDLFQVSSPTLWAWAKKYPLLRPRKQGRFNMYDKKSVQEHMNNLPMATAYMTADEIKSNLKR